MLQLLHGETYCQAQHVLITVLEHYGPWYAPGISGISLLVDRPHQIGLHHPCLVGLLL